MDDELYKAVMRLTREVTQKLDDLSFAHPNILLTSYYGSSSGRSFQSFIREFNRVANASGWDEESAYKIFRRA